MNFRDMYIVVIFTFFKNFKTRNCVMFLYYDIAPSVTINFITECGSSEEIARVSKSQAGDKIIAILTYNKPISNFIPCNVNFYTVIKY